MSCLPPQACGMRGGAKVPKNQKKLLADRLKLRPPGPPLNVQNPRPPRGWVPWTPQNLQSPPPPRGRVRWSSRIVHDPWGGSPVQGGRGFKVTFVSMMSPDVMGGAPVRGNHLGTVELAVCGTLQVRVRATIDMRSCGCVVRGRESATRSQKSSFPRFLNVL